jgi:hypothetical protein
MATGTLKMWKADRGFGFMDGMLQWARIASVSTATHLTYSHSGHMKADLELEAALKCRSCRTPRYSPPVHMIRLTKEQKIAAYVWVHPDDDR